MKKAVVSLLVLIGMLGLGAFAQNSSMGATTSKDKPDGAETKAAPAKPAGYRGEVLDQIADLEKKFTDLAEKEPQEKYSWRPGEGVRSIGEVYLHVTAGNYGIAGATGTPPPADVKPGELEKSTTEKAKIIAALKRSFAHVRQIVENIPDSDLDKQVKWGKGTRSVRFVLMFIVVHQSEHLGQSIAYARSNGIVPPWSEPKPAPKPDTKK